MDNMMILGAVLITVGFLIGTFASYIGYILPMKWDNRNLREAIKKGAEAILEAVSLTSKNTTNNPLVVEDIAKVKSLEDDLSRQVSENIIANADMDVLRAENNVLTSQIHILEQSIESVTFDLEMSQQNLATVKAELASTVTTPIRMVSADTITDELKDAIADLIVNLDTPKTSYEAGVYNGVIALSNTLLGADTYPMISPVVEARVAPTVAPTVAPIKVVTTGVHNPKRDAKGRFLKVA
jgi:hypothetical protein